MSLLKIIESASDKLLLNKKHLFESLVEMSYQFVILGKIEKKYQYLQAVYQEFTVSYINEVKDTPFRDILGELMSELNVLCNGKYSRKAQHFTPQELAESVSALLGKKKHSDHQTVSDICCGSGSLVLAEMNKRVDSGYKGTLSLVLNDLDRFVCKVATIQIEFNNLIHVKNQYELSYIIYNHDALLEYNLFCNGIVFNSNVIGCSATAHITESVIEHEIWYRCACGGVLYHESEELVSFDEVNSLYSCDSCDDMLEISYDFKSWTLLSSESDSVREQYKIGQVYDTTPDFYCCEYRNACLCLVAGNYEANMKWNKQEFACDKCKTTIQVTYR
ncbi:TPA: SAM-dependent DNA methyltransferase [Vibrio parahaemolyticus]|uniref:N-6 DNA methylase n=1 Tax=Vibrio parahaemolyticus TaxID=670 RepID=UPI000416F7D0|nr:N-6 DNA methylase [Vibrio parahaemolyticus]EIO5874412.1 SAM-dependent DNA methyltransferase [Vibrio parahaemolyticus]EKD9040520.1 SAM-dependent DNA methyltransferase [Vibrio parahaemolyticus]EME0147321.1 SAM-dependent DNA methyltransferase [Vibrio parahaemolyticus]MBE4031910.1 SAM-dependent DNA methyltransferase [Vibrio parahaemolyticus]HCG8773559.1 SAM-dependent DNA methyltransferase [Vibrio parahaemolyticus]